MGVVFNCLWFMVVVVECVDVMEVVWVVCGEQGVLVG